MAAARCVVQPSMKGSEPEHNPLGSEPLHLGLAPRVRGWPRATSAADERNPWSLVLGSLRRAESHGSSWLKTFTGGACQLWLWVRSTRVLAIRFRRTWDG
jgi:hypothetical protein